MTCRLGMFVRNAHGRRRLAQLVCIEVHLKIELRPTVEDGSSGRSVEQFLQRNMTENVLRKQSVVIVHFLPIKTLDSLIENHWNAVTSDAVPALNNNNNKNNDMYPMNQSRDRRVLTLTSILA